MIVDVSTDMMLPIVGSIVGAFWAAHIRTVSADNRTLRVEINSLRQKQNEDMGRMNAVHESIWDELKLQRDAISGLKEAVIRSNLATDRTNTLLTAIEQALDDKVSTNVCELMRKSCANRIRGDIRHESNNGESS